MTLGRIILLGITERVTLSLIQQFRANLISATTAWIHQRHLRLHPYRNLVSPHAFGILFKTHVMSTRQVSK